MKPDIEDLLKRQRPRAPRPELDERIQQLLDMPSDNGAVPPDVPGIDWFWLAAAAVLVLAVVIFVTFGRQAADESEPFSPSQPVVEHHPQAPGATPRMWESTWSERELGDPIILDHGVPVHPVLENTVRYTRWEDPETNVVYEQTEPVQKLYFVTTQIQ